jgi:tetratricopeptide (TPR) repeat protein
MKNFKMSKIKLLVIITLIISVFSSIVMVPDALAAKKKKKISDEEITQITQTVNYLTKKIYSAGLFSPKDNSSLIDIKLQLDEAFMANPNNKDFPQLYYKIGFVYKEREYKEEAIECFELILNNYSDSPFAEKSINELKKMGVKIKSPEEQDSNQ